MKFLEIFGYHPVTSDGYYSIFSDFKTIIKRELEFKKEWRRTFLVKCSDIIRIQQFTIEENTYYLVIVANQYGHGNLDRKDKNELGVIIDDGEYVQIKEFLNQ